MQNKAYKTVQIPVDDYELLRDFCEFHGLKMGKHLGKLIQAGCPPIKKVPENIIRVATEKVGH